MHSLAEEAGKWAADADARLLQLIEMPTLPTWDQAAKNLFMFMTMVAVLFVALSIYNRLKGEKAVKVKKTKANNKRPLLTYLVQRLKRAPMGKRAREDTIRRYIADGVTDLFYEAERKGIMNRDETNHWSRIIANIVSMPDLLPRGELPLKMKLAQAKLKRELHKKHGAKLQALRAARIAEANAEYARRKAEKLGATAPQPAGTPNLQQMVAAAVSK